MATLDLRRARERYERSMADHGVPDHLRDGLIGHVLEGRQTGGFLYQVLSDNLASAVCRADWTITLDELRATVKWLVNEAPAQAWGSEEAVAAWKQRGGEAGR